LKQTKLESLVEANINTISGFVVGYFLAYTILPLYGMEQSHADSLQITIIFTIASLSRNYAIRRYFNSKKVVK